MIYKDGLRVKKIETIIDSNPDKIAIHCHLSDGEIFTYQPKDNVDPSIFHNRTKLKVVIVALTSRALTELSNFMED